MITVSSQQELQDLIDIILGKCKTYISNKCSNCSGSGNSTVQPFNLFTENTPSVKLLGNGTITNKLKAEVLISSVIGNSLTINPDGLFVSNTGYTDEEAQDAVGTILNPAEFVYNDIIPSIDINQIDWGKIINAPAFLTNVPISILQPAIGGNSIDNAAFSQDWQWNALGSGPALKLSSTSVNALGSTNTILEILTTGANTNAAQTTYGAKISNTHSGTTSSNVGIDVSASGGTNGITSNIAGIFSAPSGAFNFAPVVSFRNTGNQKLDINIASNDAYLIPSGNKVIVTKGFSLFASVIEKANMYFGSSAGGTTTTESGVLLEAFTSTVLRGHFNGQSSAVAPATGAYANILFGGNHAQVGTMTTAPLIANVAIKKQNVYLEDAAVATDVAALFIEGEYNITNPGIGSSITNGYALLVGSGKVAIGRPTAPVPTALLSLNSTTRGFLVPRMTTVQKNAIVSPSVGLIVFDTTLNQPCYYNGAVWVCGWSGGGGGSGSVTMVSVNASNGFSGTVTNATTTPAIDIETTVTGILKGNGTAVSAATPGVDYLVSNQSISFVPTGDVTGSASGTVSLTPALTIGNNIVTYAKMQDVSATSRFIGRISGGAGDPEELTGTQATTLLDTFSSTLKGLAPASGGGTSNFLRADGTWTTPSGSGANTALSNLASVAINTHLLPGADGTIDLGSPTFQFRDLYLTGASLYIAGFKTLATAGLTLPTGGAVRTSTGAGNTLLLQAYDVDGTSYTTFATLTANNTPTMDLSSAVTIGGSAILFSGGALGTPASANLSNATNLPVSTGISGFGTGVATALGVNVGSAGAFVTFNGAGGTPSSITLTNGTGLPVSTGISGLGSGVATFLASASSANLLAAVTDETGTGVLVFNNSPTFLDDITVGTAGTATGQILLKGTTSGTVTLTVNAAAGTPTITFGTLTGNVAVSANKLDFFAATTSAELAGVLSDETGTGGGFVRATAPAMTSITLGAGTATAGTGPLYFTSGTNLTAPVSGVKEFDGKTFYNTTDSGRGVAPSMMFSRLTSNFTMSDVNTVQPVFAAAQDVFTLQASTTYLFRGVYTLTHGATSHSVGMSFELAGGASLTSILYTTICWVTAINTNTASQTTNIINVATNTAINAAGANAVEQIHFWGHMSVNAGGTVQPSVTFSSAPGGAPAAVTGTYIEFIPIGSNTVQSVGNVA